ncbi:MAG: MotA/TolQ/ExbB proton channel family protein [Verrucomicrobiales bacterium]|nr:MotA/TolQ/ExbB proton channel family protein [Verrucomicrobiales bacterium]
MVKEAAPLNETQARSLRYAFRTGFREAQIRLDQGMAGFRFIGIASILLGLIGFVWTLMSGLDGAREASEVLPILGSSLGFVMVALMVATPAIIARSAFAMILRGRKQELRRFHDDLVKLFEGKFCAHSANAERSSYVEGAHDSDDDESSGTGGKKQYHSIRERLLSGPSEPLNLDEIQINPIARQAGARAH